MHCGLQIALPSQTVHLQPRALNTKPKQEAPKPSVSESSQPSSRPKERPSQGAPRKEITRIQAGKLFRRLAGRKSQGTHAPTPVERGSGFRGWYGLGAVWLSTGLTNGDFELLCSINLSVEPQIDTASTIFWFLGPLRGFHRPFGDRSLSLEVVEIRRALF